METSVNNKCRAFTSLEQSKKLAEFLPLESADMVYVHTVDLEGDEHYDIDFCNNQPLFEDDICAWSLAALFSVLPDECECMALEHINYGNNHKKYFMHYIGGENTEDYDNPVDACVAMIEKLNELKML